MSLYISLYDRLKNQHETIDKIISNINIARLTFHPSSDKWSIQDNIVHLAKYQPIFLDRINTILKNNSPTFERYTAENDPDFEKWRQHDLSNLLDRFHTDRIKIFNTITGLTESELNRTGVHKKYGKLTITQWAEFFILHEAHHIFTIFKLAYDSEIK